jgi:hypothetical protein
VRLRLRSLPAPLAVLLAAAPLLGAGEGPSREGEVVLPSGRRARSATLAPWDGQAGDRFGHALAAEGDWLLAASPGDDLQGRDSGSVGVWRHELYGWRQVDRLEPSDGRRGDDFGRAVSLSGEVAAVGAPWDDDLGERSGSVYLFGSGPEGWTERQKLTAFDGQPDDRFGCAVAIDGSTLAVGARLADEGGRDRGAVYLYERREGRWRATTKLVSHRVSESAEYGFALALDGDLLAVGAWGDDLHGSDDGSVHLYRRLPGGWTLEAVLLAADGARGGCFGITLDLEAGRCVVGAPWESREAPRAGAAYVFRERHGRWVQEARLTAEEPTAGGTFGAEVSLAGRELLVGARFGSERLRGAGSLEVFVRRAEEWTLTERLELEESAPGDDFGLAAVAARGWWLVAAKRLGPDGRARGSGLVRAWKPDPLPPVSPSAPSSVVSDPAMEGASPSQAPGVPPPLPRAPDGQRPRDGAAAGGA